MQPPDIVDLFDTLATASPALTVDPMYSDGNTGLMVYSLYVVGSPESAVFGDIFFICHYVVNHILPCPLTLTQGVIDAAADYASRLASGTGYIPSAPTF